MQTNSRKDGQAGGQTDTTMLIVAFRNFVNAQKKYNFTSYFVLVDGPSQIEGMEGQGAEENIWTRDEGCNGRLEKTV